MHHIVKNPVFKLFMSPPHRLRQFGAGLMRFVVFQRQLRIGCFPLKRESNDFEENTGKNMDASQMETKPPASNRLNQHGKRKQDFT